MNNEYLFFLAVVASMTIKPTITVNGPRPTVAAVAAGNTNYINYLNLLIFFESKYTFFDSIIIYNIDLLKYFKFTIHIHFLKLLLSLRIMNFRINYFFVGEKKITSTVKPTMSYTNAIISSDFVSKSTQQPPPPAPSKVVQSVSVTPASTTVTVTISATPTTTSSVSATALSVMTKSTNVLPLAQPKLHQEPSVSHHPVAIVSPMVSSAPPPPQPQIKPQVVDASEYSLFDSFSKVYLQYNFILLLCIKY